MNRLYAIVFPLVLIGCVTPEPLSVRYDVDRFGVPVPIVDGKRYPMSESERRRIGQSFVDEYCAP